LEGRLQATKGRTQMTCVICKNKTMTRGTTVLPIERRKAVLLITDIPARICANCGEPYIDEKIVKEVQQLANEELNGRVTLRKGRDRRTVVVAEFA
jgi:YgiT-type zinc finger domain-containing protein